MKKLDATERMVRLTDKSLREQLLLIKKDVEFINKTRSCQKEELEDLDEIVKSQYHLQDTITEIIDSVLERCGVNQIKANALCYALHQALTSPNIEVAIEGVEDNQLAQFIQCKQLAQECVKAYDELDDDFKKLCFWWDETYRNLAKAGE